MSDDPRSTAARILAGFRPRIVRQCLICGVFFETYATGKIGRYCSRKCRQKGYRQEHLDSERERQRRQKRQRTPASPEG